MARQDTVALYACRRGHLTSRGSDVAKPIEVVMESRNGQTVTVYTGRDADFIRRADRFMIKCREITRDTRRKKPRLR